MDLESHHKNKKGDAVTTKKRETTMGHGDPYPSKSNLVSLITGLIFNVAVSIFFGLAASLLFGLVSGFVAMLLSVVIFGLLGLKEVPFEHKAIPLLFGAPVSSLEESQITFGPGLNWHLPLLTDLEIVDCRELPYNYKLTKVVCKDGVLVAVDVAMLLKLVDPYRWIKTGGIIGKRDEETGMVSGGGLEGVLYSAIRRKAETKTSEREGPDSIIGQGGDIAEELRQELQDFLQAWGFDGDLQDRELRVPAIIPPSEVTSAYAKRSIEEAERDAETIELDHLNSRAQEMVNASKDDDGKPSITFLQAADIIQAERDKVTRVVTSGGRTGDFSTAEAIRQSGQRRGDRKGKGK